MASSADMIRLRQHVDQRLVGLRQERLSGGRIGASWRSTSCRALSLAGDSRTAAGRGSPINQRIIRFDGDAGGAQRWPPA